MKTLLANLVRNIEEFAGSLEFASELTRAKKQFFAPVGAPGENGANAEVELSNFIEWFVFNWSLPDGLNVWAKYLRFQGSEHTPEELDLLKQMDHQIYSLFLVKKDKPGKEAVADIVTGKKYQPVHELSAGLHSVCWDGLASGGKPMAPGVYFARLRIGEHSSTRALVRVR